MTGLPDYGKGDERQSISRHWS